MAPIDIEQARAEQRRLAGRVALGPAMALPSAVCGVDVSYHPESNLAVAAAVVIDSDTLELTDHETVVGTVDFPYIPGLLSFRDLPLALAALAKLSAEPELVMVDGHGYAHPQRLGLAAHLGVELGKAVIGCAKTAFIGRHREPGPRRGDWSRILDGEPGEVIGQALRTQDGVKPVFVSPGNLIDFDSARSVVLSLSSDYRLPETTRQADQLSRRVLAAQSGGGDPASG